LINIEIFRPEGKLAIIDKLKELPYQHACTKRYCQQNILDWEDVLDSNYVFSIL